jgi:hypothetical protein
MEIRELRAFVAVAEEGGMSAAAGELWIGVPLELPPDVLPFALASPTWARPLPEGMTWHRLVGDPIVRRT